MAVMSKTYFIHPFIIHYIFKYVPLSGMSYPRTADPSMSTGHSLSAGLTGNPHTDLWTAAAVEEKPLETFSPPLSLNQKSSWFNSVILAQKKL